MKTNIRSKKHRTTLLISTAVLMLFGLAYGYYFFTTKDNLSTGSINYSPATQEEIDAGKDIKEQIVQGDEGNPAPGSDPLPNPVQQEDGSLPVVGVNVVAVTKNGDSYRVQTFIQTVTDSGQCIIEITDNTNRSYRATADVQALPSSSTCKGFTIPANELSDGKWNIKLRFQNESVRGSVEKVMDVS